MLPSLLLGYAGYLGHTHCCERTITRESYISGAYYNSICFCYLFVSKKVKNEVFYTSNNICWRETPKNLSTKSSTLLLTQYMGGGGGGGVESIKLVCTYVVEARGGLRLPEKKIRRISNIKGKNSQHNTSQTFSVLAFLKEEKKND